MLQDEFEQAFQEALAELPLTLTDRQRAQFFFTFRNYKNGISASI